ncbi:hypothetical protein KY334_03600 [Candidatus Woesearchaeota archaeon]|nr:hypothetical protein [Candidatus Woesearchaeota archaeon]
MSEESFFKKVDSYLIEKSSDLSNKITDLTGIGKQKVVEYSLRASGVMYISDYFMSNRATELMLGTTLLLVAPLYKLRSTETEEMSYEANGYTPNLQRYFRTVFLTTTVGFSLIKFLAPKPETDMLSDCIRTSADVMYTYALYLVSSKKDNYDGRKPKELKEKKKGFLELILNPEPAHGKSLY